MKFPKTIYVQIEQDGNTDILLADFEVKSRDDGKVGVYELKEVKKKTTEVKLV